MLAAGIETQGSYANHYSHVLLVYSNLCIFTFYTCRKLCGVGPPLLVHPPPSEPTNCGLLHHNNPYLRKNIFNFKILILLVNVNHAELRKS